MDLTSVNRIVSIFRDLRTQRRAALMPFITAGHPTLEVTERLIPALQRSGASIVEVGFPFSDPIADGPVIAASMHEALGAGVTPGTIFESIKRVRPSTNMGLIAMVSDSIITRMGPEHFVHDAAAAGFDGLIVPDIDLDASVPLRGLARMHGLTFTTLIAPTTSPARIRTIADSCTGFLYLLARAGITGERDQIDVTAIRERVALVRQHSDLPVAVGFGISRPEHVAAITQVADAAIVGSALVRAIGQAGAEGAVAAAEWVISELATGLRAGVNQ